jgi:hypothetical protein
MSDRSGYGIPGAPPQHCGGMALPSPFAYTRDMDLVRVRAVLSAS